MRIPAPFEDMVARGNGWWFLPRAHPDITHPGPPMLDDLHVPPKVLFDPYLKVTLLVGAIGPDQTQTRKRSLQRLQQKFASLMILDVGLMNQQVQQEAIGINQHMPLAAFHPLATIVAATPPFWLSFTD